MEFKINYLPDKTLSSIICFRIFINIDIRH